MLLLEALKWNKSDYVEALLDDGVQLPLEYMGTLYSTVKINPDYFQLIDICTKCISILHAQYLPISVLHKMDCVYKLSNINILYERNASFN